MKVRFIIIFIIICFPSNLQLHLFHNYVQFLISHCQKVELRLFDTICRVLKSTESCAHSVKSIFRVT